MFVRASTHERETSRRLQAERTVLELEHRLEKMIEEVSWAWKLLHRMREDGQRVIEEQEALRAYLREEPVGTGRGEERMWYFRFFLTPQLFGKSTEFAFEREPHNGLVMFSCKTHGTKASLIETLDRLIWTLRKQRNEFARKED